MTVEKIFLSLLNMSLTASVVITVVFFARLVLKRAPKWVRYALWAVVLFNLLCPFKLESVFSLQPLKPTPIPLNIGMQATPRIDSGVLIINNAVNAVLPAAMPAAAPAANVNPLKIWIVAGAYIWLVGIAALLAYAVVTYARLKRKLRFATKRESDVYETDRIRSPFVLGFVRPKIYLPIGLSDADLTYILFHERTHIKRRDYIVKPAAFLALAVHWFNPLVWLAYFLLNADMEMSCDERTLKELGGEIKAVYSNALLALSTGKRLVGLSPLTFGEGGIKERIRNVMKFKKASKVIIVAAVALAVVLSAGFAVSKASPLNGDKNEPNMGITADSVSADNYDLAVGQDITSEGSADFQINESEPTFSPMPASSPMPTSTKMPVSSPIPATLVDTEQNRDYTVQLYQDYAMTEIVVTLRNGDILKKTYDGWYFNSSYQLYADLTGDGVDEIILALQIGGSNYSATDIHVLSVSDGILTEILTIMDATNDGEREIAYKDSIFVIPLIITNANGIPANELEYYYRFITGVEILKTPEGDGLWVEHLIKHYDVIPYSVILWNGTEWFAADQGVRLSAEPAITAPLDTVLPQITDDGYNDDTYPRENGDTRTALNTTAFSNETEFIQTVKDKLFSAYDETVVADWTQQYIKALARPGYLPGRFKRYDGLFVKDNPGIPGNTMTAQFWYDPQTFEILTVTQNETDGRDRAGMFVFADKFEDGGKVQSVFPWVSCVASYPIDRNGMSIYGYMLAIDNNQKDECEKILTSLGELSKNGEPNER